ncbi:MAG: helix-turn-helix transcriptional regulator [Cephaloticoccus sp.]|nr:helix-turn-helix transcriptional regulator [Cephaloticoccus sp.]MCF7761741.1 helix-turn-helix transcriptional regulator [Cephaloticoccus sp.]
MPSTDIFPVVRVGAEEIQTDPNYRFENAAREGMSALVIQRTLGGAAWFRDHAGARPVEVGQAMLFTHNENSAYGYPPDGTAPYRLRFISFFPTGIQPLFDRLRTDFGAVVRMPDNSEATTLFDEIIQRFRRRQFRDRLHETELLYRLLLSLYREQVQETRTTDPIEFGQHFLRNHFRSPINLKAVAEKCGVSREHFIRQFSARYRESPGALLRRLRLEHARAMLLSTQLSVQDIALASGFTSSNTFCRAYRLKFGQSPGTLRP